MSETKLAPARTSAQLQNQYTQLCAKSGHIQYQIFALKTDLEAINNALRDLNLEAAQALSQEKADAEAKAAAEAAAASVEEAKNA